ncbi:N-acetylmuramoyl-L-alanine amidase [Heliobacillus mobilis]|uniref:N-acetylmuramoyl-L-alanine amidase n=1 Tax=Heliobacterium mobile TaxID=28064 RepID=A0A6I3SBG7_HELMO|nr:N-acetylmuramoyl-L-alanine amidase [Heliobacterium mobile]MTV47777.1 N-acetylmuramoyl-L-alanine amidase [Heliobacterium mobile]
MPKVGQDYGHGGKDSGALGPNKTKESDVVLAIGQKAAEYLRSVDIEVVETRTDDSTVSLDDRCKIANAAGCDLFVSYHGNSDITGRAFGSETYCLQKGGRGEQLAAAIQKRLTEALGTADRGVKEANFYVLRYTQMPAALVEIAFISNPDEEAILTNEEKQNIAALAIARGIAEQFGKEIPDPVPPAPEPEPEPAKPEPTAFEKEQAAAIEWCKKNGYIKNFDNKEPITREYLAVILHRIHGPKG